MISEQAVREALHTVHDPEIGKPLDDLGMLGSLEISDSEVRVEVLLTVAGCPMKTQIVDRVTDAVSRVPGVADVDVRFGVMDPQKRAQLAEGLGKGIPFRRPDSRTAVIGISSGKGGVGKSTVTTNIAAALHSLGHKVGVLDADIWGFSQPRMFGLRGQRPVAFDGMIMPLIATPPAGATERRSGAEPRAGTEAAEVGEHWTGPAGVKVISIGFFLEDEQKPVVWRGPMLHKALEQFLTDVYWGDDLEYLLIDLPPGTGDISLSLATFLPSAAMIVVTTPQPVAQKVAERAANMASQVKQRVLGVIENMSGVVCAHCGESTPVFGEGGGEALAHKLEVPMIAKLPLVPELRICSDEGTPFVWQYPIHPVTTAYVAAARRVAEFRPRRRLPVAETR